MFFGCVYELRQALSSGYLLNRGAELIEELSEKQILKQQELEKTVLQKIKNKMDSIKAAQKKIKGNKSKDASSHQEGKRGNLLGYFWDQVFELWSARHHLYETSVCV